VLEAPGSRLVGVEVKASASLTQSDFNGLRELASAAGNGFARGVVLYTGEQLVPFDERLWAMPLGVWWAGGARAT
jgi:predicted AAA+ superfamily ATPase